MWGSASDPQEREHACDDLAVSACGDASRRGEAWAMPSATVIFAARTSPLHSAAMRLTHATCHSPVSGPPSPAAGSSRILGASPFRYPVHHPIGCRRAASRTKVTGSTEARSVRRLSRIRPRGPTKALLPISIDARGKRTENTKKRSDSASRLSSPMVDHVTKLAAARPCRPIAAASAAKPARSVAMKQWRT